MASWQKVKDYFGDKLQENSPLSTITTVQTGGNAKGLVKVKTQEELIDAVNFLKENGVKFLVVGGLSNLLFPDEGYDGVIVKNEVEGIKLDNEILTVKSGTVLQQLVDFTIEKGLNGLDKMTGIPGTVGGAIYGDAGAYGQTISDYLTSVTVLHNGQIVKLLKDECGFTYRNSIFKQTKDIILEAAFKLIKDDSQHLVEESKEVYSIRIKKYPPGLKSPGSFFMNIPVEKIPERGMKLIPEDKIKNGRAHVGWLLESVGAKGMTEGGVHVADYHGNLFLNDQNGTSLDYYKLAKELSTRIKEKYGIILEPEVQLIDLPKL
ncbi:UDP-N-acetylmuramate dehydrogenase [Candidatus Roizmanbacteria bacterium]|nr:UDP-N-acetylmuramate dehydrogenase [Candidatus Roizmanbacteria bacterium]